MSDRQNPNDPTYDWLYSGERGASRRGRSQGQDDTQYVGQADDFRAADAGDTSGPGATQMMPPASGASDSGQQPPPRDSFGGTYPAPSRPSPPPASGRPTDGSFAPSSNRPPHGPGGPSGPSGPGGPYGPGGPGGPAGRSPRARGRSKRKWWIRGVLAVVVLYLIFLVVTPLIALQKIDRVNAEPNGSRPDDTPGTTYLLVGNSARKSARATLADTILMLHVTEGGGPNLLISIPRDSEVDIPGYGTNKINAAMSLPGKLGAGRRLLVRTVEHNTGVRVDNYVEVGFRTFPRLVDAVGGVDVCLKRKELDSEARAQLAEDGFVEDKLARLKMEPGCQEVDGQGAFAFSRARHIFAYGDLARGQHQREVIGAIGDKILSPWTFVLPWRYWSINMQSAEVLTIGENVSTWDLVRFARAVTGTPRSCVVPAVSLSDLSWDDEASDEFFAHVKDDDTEGADCSLR